MRNRVGASLDRARARKGCRPRRCEPARAQRRDAPVDDELIALLKQNGTILNPTLTVGGGYARMFQALVDHKAPLADDPNGCVDAAT